MRENLLTLEDMENLRLAEDLAKTCFEMYSVTSTGLAPEIAYFNTEVSLVIISLFVFEYELSLTFFILIIQSNLNMAAFTSNSHLISL